MHRFPLCLATVLFFALAPSVHAQFGDRAIENAKRVGSIIDGAGKPLGSCFYMDARGYVATSFANVHLASNAKVRFNSGETFAVSGVVAASKGKDIALLELRGMDGRAAALRLDPKAKPEINDVLIRWGGPLASAADLPTVGGERPMLGESPHRWEPTNPTVLLPKLARTLRGDEYVGGLSIPPAHAFAANPDAVWLWLDQPRHRDCSGGPVFNAVGDVVAMASGALDPGQQIYTAIHAKHIAALVPTGKVETRPLKSLKTWTDPIEIASEMPEAQAYGGFGGQLQRGWALAERFRDHQERLSRAEQESAANDKSRAIRKAENAELDVAISKLRERIAAERPAEKKVEKVTKTRKDKDGKDEKYDDEETTYVYSSAQISGLQALAGVVRQKRVQQIANLVQTDYEDVLHKPALGRVRRRLVEETFYLGDPLALRTQADREAFEQSLTQSINDGGAPGIVYLLRGLTRVSLGKFAEGDADLDEAIDADAKLKPLALAVTARSQSLQGNADAATKTITLALAQAKNDPRVWMIAARIELDRGTDAQAIKYVQKAAVAGGDAAEIKHVLAWVQATSGGVPKLAIAAAEDAVRATGGRDWSSIAALAAAHALAHDFETAASEIEAALRLAPPVDQELCRGWQEQIAKQMPIERLWK